MRVVVGILITIISTYIGYRLSIKYHKRKIFFYEFSNFNKLLISELGFLKSPMPEIVKSINNKNSDFFNKINSFLDADHKDFSINYLAKEEEEYFNDYVKNISEFDDKTLSSYLNLSMKNINNYYELALTEDKKFRPLYIKLGFLIGLIILIIII